MRRHLSKDLDGFASFMENPTATVYLSFTAEQRTYAGARQMLEYVIASYETDQPVFSLTIAGSSSDAYLGSCGLQPLEDGDGVEVFYTVLPEYQRQGVATEAIRRLINYVFENTDEQRIVAFVVLENISSIRVLEKLRFADNGPVVRRRKSEDIPHGDLAGHCYLLLK